MIRLLWMLSLLLTGTTVKAQFSPGKLAAPHAALEGMENCVACHEPGRQTTEERCLACHTEIVEAMRADRGLHTEKERQGKDCALCHSDHHGRSFELVHWPEGIGNFDHGRTAFLLQEAHAALECRECHNPTYVRKDFAEAHQAFNPERGYLGLDRSCTGCHQDPHREELGSTCIECHSARSWQALPGFDHARAWPLEGAHVSVECGQCHFFPPDLPEAQRVEGARRWRGIPAGSCTECHNDPHENRLGSRCLDCHSLWSFRDAGEVFDHSLTAWPLRGAHEGVACEQCHGAENRDLRPAFASCTDCHGRPHGGQFLEGEPRITACTLCHDEAAWRPADYGLAEHAEHGWPLEGAHGAVPCALCHVAGDSGGPVRWRGVERECAACHASPHEEEESFLSCAECHGSEEWSVRSFDHDGTAFPLEGAHGSVGCGECHWAEDEPRVPLRGLALDCAGCHQDPHRGQFAESVPQGCVLCHGNEHFVPTVFDHDSMSRYALDGAHRALACAACHHQEQDEQGLFVRYRPLGTDCSDCHGGSPKKTEKP